MRTELGDEEQLIQLLLKRLRPCRTYADLAMDGTMLTPGEAARALNVDVLDLDYLVSMGQLRAFQVRRTFRCYNPIEVGELAVKRARDPRYFDVGDDAPAERPQHLYVLELVGHAVKVGVTLSPDRRMKQHATMAKNHGQTLGRVWVSPVHLEALSNERALMGGGRTEYLARDYDEVVSRALELPMTPVEVTHG